MPDFSKKAKVTQAIPTSSMADIAFLLLVFFMVTTVFVRYRIPNIVLPNAEKIEEIKLRRHIQYLWISADRKVYVNDMQLSDVKQIATLFYDFRVANPRMIVSLKCDRRAPVGLISQALEELRKADALRINFATDKER
jgi:biopolymer transport protein ExbD